MHIVRHGAVETQMLKADACIEDFMLKQNVCILNTGNPTYFHPGTGSLSAIDLSLCLSGPEWLVRRS